MSNEANNQLGSVQYLRAIAAILVTIAHASEEAKYFYGFIPWFETDSFGKGVDLFFVISGFIIYYSSIKLFDRPDASVAFARNRAIRVVPLYFIATTLMVAVVVMFPAGIKEARFDIWQIVNSYTFIPFARYDGRIAPILSLGWTLNYEIYFYVLFSFSLMAPRRLVGPLAIVVISLLALGGLLVPRTAAAAFRAWTDNIVVEFAMGIGIAMLFERHGKFRISLGWTLLLAATGFALLFYLNTPPKPFGLPRCVSAGVPAAMITFAAVLMLPDRIERRLPRFGVALGDSSYSLYLSHRFIQRPIQILVTRLAPVGPEHIGGVYLVAAVAAAIVVGHLVFLSIERPLLRRMRSATASSKTTRTPE